MSLDLSEILSTSIQSINSLFPIPLAIKVALIGGFAIVLAKYFLESILSTRIGKVIVGCLLVGIIVKQSI